MYEIGFICSTWMSDTGELSLMSDHNRTVLEEDRGGARSLVVVIVML